MNIGVKSDRWHIGIVGGSGLAGGIELEDAQDIEVVSAFGEPSGPVRTGMLNGHRFTFIARHGKGHAIPPGQINYRANIDVLKRCGVTDIVALSAIGSLRQEMEPGQFVCVDQLIDCTSGRQQSFFGPGLVAHVSLADPMCPRLSALVTAAARQNGAIVHDGGCCIAIEGPQFSTRAESRMYRAWGADVIGMTAMPEARLAREAELPYALLGMVTDWDSWHEGGAEVNAAQILKVMHDNVSLARETVNSLAAALPPEREASPIDHALDNTVMTDRAAWDVELVARLGAVAGRVLN